jgi:cytochrome oxidase Cu insertion factor (SCO1/SenC/PrrC family)
MLGEEPISEPRRTYAVTTTRAVSAVLTLLLMWAALGWAQQSPLQTSVKVGEPAPDFTLQDQDLKPVKLSDFKGKKNVVLAFYVLAFTGG